MVRLRSSSLAGIARRMLRTTWTSDSYFIAMGAITQRTRTELPCGTAIRSGSAQVAIVAPRSPPILGFRGLNGIPRIATRRALLGTRSYIFPQFPYTFGSHYYTSFSSPPYIYLSIISPQLSKAKK